MLNLIKSAVHNVAWLWVRYFPFRMGKNIFWNFTSWRIFEYTTKTQFGMYITGNTQDVIQRYIYYFGIWEPHISAFISSRLKPGDIFIDIGANIGYYSLLTSRLVGTNGKVIAIEASPKVFELLKKQIIANKVENIRILCCAVSNKRARLTVHHAEDTNIGATSIVRNFNNSFLPNFEVDAAPLGDLLSNEEIAMARMIKIDVEGAEWLVVEGMRPIFKQLREDVEILLEVSKDQLEQFGKTFDDLLMEFKNYGFNAYIIRNEYKPDDYLYRTPMLRPQRLLNSPGPLVDLIFSKKDQDFL